MCARARVVVFFFIIYIHIVLIWPGPYLSYKQAAAFYPCALASIFVFSTILAFPSKRIRTSTA